MEAMGRRRGRRRTPFKLNIKKDTVLSLSSLLMFLCGILIMVSFTRQTAVFLRLNTELVRYLGWTAFASPFIFFSAGLMLTRLKWRIASPNLFLGSLLLTASLAALTKAGKIGVFGWENVAVVLTDWGSGILYTVVVLLAIVIMTEVQLDEILMVMAGIFNKIKAITGWFFKKKDKVWETDNLLEKIKLEDKKPVQSEKPVDASAKSSSGGNGIEVAPATTLMTPAIPGSSPVVWEYPPLSLLSDVMGGEADRGDVKKNAEIIETTLDSFGIEARVVDVNRGPAITQYALQIASGTKLTKITTLQNDLALALAAPTGQIRIEAPIPGKSLVGIEIPNRTPKFVSMKEMMASEEMKSANSKLSVGLGLDVSGKPIIADIEKMPHVLIAGATGSGKSVAINSFLCNILFRASPEEIKLLMVDPKRVELTGYNGIPHLIAPVIVDPKQVLSALKWALNEMEQRYKRFAEVGARNIQMFNELSGFQAMPYILIVVDELADIMLYAPGEVETAITRLAQMARATGIHLIVSTQRPSTDVVTGLIKANIPCRIAFNVASMVDSRVIIDMPGAEKLLGRGDMLYIPPDQAKPTRIQGTYVSNKEIDVLIKYLRDQGVRPVYESAVTEKYPSGKVIVPAGGEIGELDELAPEALRVIFTDKRASASLFQRRFKVGYTRAARILDQLEKLRIIGPGSGAKARELLVSNLEEGLARLSGAAK